MRSFLNVSRLFGVVIVLSFLFQGVLAGCGGVDPLGENTDLSDTDTQQLDHDQYDGVTPLRARTPELQLSVSPTVNPNRDEGDARWRIAFESNRPLLSAIPFGAGGELGRSEFLDEYRFEVILDSAELKHVLSGAQLYLMLRTSTGERRDFAGMVRLASRFVEPTGSLLIWLQPQIQRVEGAREVQFSGIATTASQIDSLSVFTDSGADPEGIGFLGNNRWSVDWSLPGLIQAAESIGNPVYFVGREANGSSHELQARIHVVVDELGLTTGDAEHVWPATH